MEIRITFVNEKEKETGSQMDWRIRMDDMLLRMLKVWNLVLGPETNCTLGDFSRGFCVPVE